MNDVYWILGGIPKKNDKFKLSKIKCTPVSCTWCQIKIFYMNVEIKKLILDFITRLLCEMFSFVICPNFVSIFMLDMPRFIFNLKSWLDYFLNVYFIRVPLSARVRIPGFFKISQESVVVILSLFLTLQFLILLREEIWRQIYISGAWREGGMVVEG